MTRSTDQRFDLAAAMKGQQWERCKGELRALIALQGSYHSAALPGQKESHEMERLHQLTEVVNEFILEVSDNALCE